MIQRLTRYPMWHSGLAGIAVAAATATAFAQNAPGVVLLSDADTTNGWTQGAALTSAQEAKQGSAAVTWTAPEQEELSTLSLSLSAAQRAQVSRAKTVSFWYRLDGTAAPRSFRIKITAAPLASGKQAIYTLTSPPLGTWHRVDLLVQEFEDQWGDRPELERGSIAFRIEKAKGTPLRLTVDDVRITGSIPKEAAVNVGKVVHTITPMITAEKVKAISGHPRLRLTVSELPAVRRRARETAAGRAFVDGLRTRCDAALAQPVALPDRGGQWYHWYACPKHGTRLRRESPTRHVCPTGGEVFTGWPYDDVALSAVHEGYATSVQELGLLYLLSGERKYADRAREVLLAYAAKYRNYPLHDINGKPNIGGGRVLPQTLDEAGWLISMAQGCDAIWDTLSPADREELKTGLFYPATETIRQHKMGVHNIQCWKNSAFGLVGLLFNDPELVADAVDNPERGFQTQILNGISDDGPWYEGAWGYHFYTMSALAPLAEALHRSGFPAYTGKLGEQYKKLYTAPLDFMMPDGKLPAFNDSGTDSPIGKQLYEVALARWRDPRFAIPLNNDKRQNAHALLSGVEQLPKPPTVAEPSRNFTASGYAILRTGTGADTAWLCLKYGPHGGGHGHPDKLNFVLFANGRILADDPGTANYGVPIQAGWYKTTLAHNTLVVDEQSQRPATGQCLDFRTNAGAGVPAVLADAGPIYEGISYRRAAFLLPEGTAAFIDLVRVTGENAVPRTLDIALHAPGSAVPPPRGNSFTLPDKPGYSYLRDAHTLPDTGPLALALTGEKTSVAFSGNAAAPTTYLVGTGVGRNTEDRVPLLVARRRAAAATYAWTLRSGDSAADTVTAVPVLGADGSPLPEGAAGAAHVRSREGATYLVIANPDGKAVRAGKWSGTDRIAVVRE